jgi:hypothetical protein
MGACEAGPESGQPCPPKSKHLLKEMALNLIEKIAAANNPPASKKETQEE